MSRLRRCLPPLLLSGLLLAACGTPERDTPGDYELEGTPGSDDIEEPDPDEAGETEPDAGETREQQQADVFEGEALTDAEMTSRRSPLGAHVVDGQGRTLYVFTEDPDGERTCTGSCVQRWPVFSTEEPPTVDGQVRQELVGTIPAEDGGLQVTYNDQPLYYYVGDDEVGDLEGQGVAGAWFVVATEGTPIEQELD